MIKCNIKTAGASIQVEAETQVGIVEAAGFWGEIPTKCGNCTSENLGFFSRTPSGNLYVGVKCHECDHSLNFGQNKEGGKLFVRHDGQWEPPYQGNQNQGEQSQPDYNNDGGANTEDQIPY